MKVGKGMSLGRKNEYNILLSGYQLLEKVTDQQYQISQPENPYSKL